VKTHRLNSLEQLAAASADWDELWRRTEFAFPSTQAALIAQWMRHFAHGRELCAIGVEEAGAWRAALPLVAGRWCGVLPVAQLPGNEWSPIGNLLLDAEHDPRGAIAALAAAIDELPYALLRLEPVRIDGPQWRLFVESLHRERRAVFVEPLFNVGQVSTDGDWGEYLASRSRNLRKDLGKAERGLEKLGRLATKLHFEPDDARLAELLERGFAVEDRSWKGRGGTSVLRTPKMLAFYRAQAALLRDRGQLQLSLLELDGLPIAFEYGWRSHATYFSFKVGYDEAYERHSPGQLLRMKLLENFFADPEVNTVDFFGPLNNALAAWATDQFRVGRIVVGRPTLLGRTLVAAYRLASSLRQRFRNRKHAQPYALRPTCRSGLALTE
jgi:CelD/BcsL family acetyltransferase involved in cellulose biosynthesis